MKRLAALVALLLLPALAIGQEIGSYPNATSPLTGTERIPADQAASFPCTGCTVNITPLQLASFTAQQATSYALLFNNNGAVGSLIPGSTGQFCLDWTALNAAPTLVTCSSSGTVNSGTLGQLTYYGATGTAVSGAADATISGGALTLGAAGSVVGETCFDNATSGTECISPPTGALGTLNITLPSSSGTLLYSGGPLGTPASGVATNLTGTATALSIGGNAATATKLDGTPTSGEFWGYNGTSQTWMTPTGSGTVNSGTAGDIGCYTATGAAISGCTVGGGLSLSGTTLGTNAPNRTAASPTIASTDMGGQVNVSSGTITIPAISSTVLAAGMTVSLVNYSGSTESVSSTPTVNAGGGCVSGTGIPAGDSWQIVSNGTTLDCIQTVSSSSGGSGITLENGGTSLGTITTLNCSTGTTCTASGGVGTLTASGGGGSSAVFYTAVGSVGTSASNFLSLPVANDQYIYSWNLTVPISISYIIVDVTTVDATDDYSFAIYNSSGTLECSTTPQDFASTGFTKIACSQGTDIALPPGKYAFGFTGTATTMKIAGAGASVATFFTRQNAGTTSGGTSLSSITYPAESLGFDSTTAVWFAVE